MSPSLYPSPQALASFKHRSGRTGLSPAGRRPQNAETLPAAARDGLSQAHEMETPS